VGVFNRNREFELVSGTATRRKNMSIRITLQPFKKRNHGDNVEEKQDNPNGTQSLGAPALSDIFSNGLFSGPKPSRRLLKNGDWPDRNQKST
jgi:hypothetical protein